jgi:phospholipid/cholesterol/gamma-HCH transport system substrate-binding protein
MTRVIRKHLRDFVAILVLGAIALVVGLYIATNQRLRIPYFQPKPFEINAAMSTAQAVTPGQGQTVQIAGVEIGQIGEVRLVDGRGVIKLQIEPRFRRLIRQDAVALLRPRTGLKDMYIQLNPGTVQAPPARVGWTIPVRNTLPDVNLDEILLALDADTRDYVRLLVNGAGRGLHRRGGELAEVFRRFEPTVRDLARVSRAVAQERAALRRLISSLAALNGELASGDNPRDLAELVDSSAITFRAFASEQAGLRATVRELPPSLRQASTTLRTVRTFANELGPTSRALLPAVRVLDDANLAVRPFAGEATPIIRDQIRPFTREIRPLLTDLQPAAAQLADATPDLRRSFEVLNHLFNMLGYNKNGREGPSDRDRDEGYLFWIAWVTHDTINLFNVDDANGPLRPVFLTGTCSTLKAIAGSNPLAPLLLNLPVLFAPGGPCQSLGPLSLNAKSARRDLIEAQRAAGVKPSPMIGEDAGEAVEKVVEKAKDKGKLDTDGQDQIVGGTPPVDLPEGVRP